MPLLHRIRKFVLARRAMDEIDEEIAAHIAMRTEHYVAEGMTPDEARRRALLQFGSVARQSEAARAVWVPVWFEHLVQDVRFSAVSLRRNVGFVLVVITTLAIAIGMNTAVLSVVEAVLIRPLPYPQAQRLLWIAPYDRNYQPERDNRVPLNDYLTLSRQMRTFEAIAAYGNRDLALTFRGSPSEERVASVTDAFWPLTGATVQVGRLFQPDETHVMVLSASLYERVFHSDPAVLGQSVTVNGYPFTIVGVLSPAYRFVLPQQAFYGDETRDMDAYIPVPRSTLLIPPMGMAAWDELAKQVGPAPTSLNVFGRLRKDVTMDAARAELGTVVAAMERGHTPERAVLDRHVGWRVNDLKSTVAGNTKQPLVIVLLASALILLIACCNIANLFLARALQRKREIAIRIALGAAAWRITRQFVTESLMLSLVGGLAGVGLAEVSVRLLRTLWPQTIARLVDATLDVPVLLMALGISVLTGLLFGVAPASLGLHASPQAALQEQGMATSGGTGRTRMRQGLITIEMAVALVLLVCAGLLFKSFSRMNANPPGFEPDKILTMRVSLAPDGYPDWPAQDGYVQRATETLLRQPGVERVGIAAQQLQTVAHVDGVAHEVSSSVRAVSVGYLRAMGISLLAGQWPSESEFDSAVLVNDAFVRALGQSDVVGKRVRAGYLTMRIAGVVMDFRTSTMDGVATPEVYGSYKLAPVTTPWTVRFYVRTSGAVSAGSLQKQLTAVDPRQPVFDVQTLEHALAESVAPRRFLLFLMGVFAVISLGMSVIGLYGVISYSVGQRTQEIGVRMALGANRGRIVRMVIREGLMSIELGTAGGVVLGVASTRLLRSQLFTVTPGDPETFVAALVVLALTAVIASAVPAIRAASVSPQVALRNE